MKEFNSRRGGERLQFTAKMLDRVIGTAGRQRLSVLIYHRVLERDDYLRPGDPTENQFDWQMSLLAKHCHPLSLADALSLMDEGNLPDRAVCVTFDDGYADNLTLALPILEKWSIPATVFVSSSFLDGGRMWNDTVLEAVRASPADYIDLSEFNLGVYPLGEQTLRRETAHDILTKIKHLPIAQRQSAVDLVAQSAASLSDDLMLTSAQLQSLASKGVEIGAHTHTHPILASLTEEQSREEILLGRKVLENTIGRKIRYFAYPNGRLGSDYLISHRDMLKEMGFEAALSTHWGVSSRNSDRWQLPRFTPWDQRPLLFLSRLLLNQRNLFVPEN